MFPPLTGELAHALTSRTHSEGITTLAATLFITYHGRILLIVDSERNGADPERWDLPATTVHPGEPSPTPSPGPWPPPTTAWTSARSAATSAATTGKPLAAAP